MSDILPSPGHESSVFLEDISGKPHILRHGSSLSLVSLACTFLADPTHEDSFNYIDPTEDHEKWTNRGMSLYYAAILDPSTNSILCALRAVTDGIDKPLAPPHPARPRFVIDYVYTDMASRGLGIADRLVGFVLATADALGANCYVLSVEESCVYWMEKQGFFLCESENLNARLNVFPDTHLLRRGSDPDDDDGDPADLAMRVVHSDSSDSESGDEGESGEASGAVPEEFSVALIGLVSDEPTPRSEAVSACLKRIALLVKNALADPDGGRRRTFRIDNTVVREQIFNVAGDAAIHLLQQCGFELSVDEAGDAVMVFRDGFGGDWLPAAIEQIELEAMK